jgi:flavin reductase (DIM6/NTAB) family NADH-FMN oxidoreductase RutF
MSSSDELQSLLGAIDYPMFIVTASDGREKAGCLVGFVTQASIDPPRMLVMVSKQNHTLRVVEGASELVLHFLHEGNLDLARLFGEETGDEVDKFSRCEWKPTSKGSPVLEGALGWACCEILSRTDVGDHVAHLVEPTSAQLTHLAPQLGFQAVRSLDPGHPA